MGEVDLGRGNRAYNYGETAMRQLNEDGEGRGG